MSHTGKRRINFRRFIRDVQEYEPRRVEQTGPVLSSRAIYDGEEFDGEFQGNGERVLIGVSNLNEFDMDNVFDGAQKGIAIGYTPLSPYFNIYSNDGTNSGVTVIPLSTLKDENYHTFNIKILSGNKATIRFDGQENTLTNNIPVVGDSLKLITYGVY